MAIAAVTAGNVIDPTTFGNAVVDELNAMEWTTFTPTWSGLTVGNGTQEAGYRYIGAQTMQVIGSVTWGSTTAITGTVALTVPNSDTIDTALVTPSSPFGQLTWFDNSAALTIPGSIQFLSTTTVVFKTWNAASTYLSAVNFSSTVPDAGAGDTSDVLSYMFTVPVS